MGAATGLATVTSSAQSPGTAKDTGAVTSPSGPAAAVTGSGRGLVGLRERLEVLGGTVVSEPTADGWQVEARIPVGGAR